MSKRTVANNWEIITRDSDGAIVNVDYTCPHCHFSTGEVIAIGESNVDCLDGSWETDQVCTICNKAVTIECH